MVRRAMFPARFFSIELDYRICLDGEAAQIQVVLYTCIPKYCIAVYFSQNLFVPSVYLLKEAHLTRPSVGPRFFFRSRLWNIGFVIISGARQ